MVATSSSVVLVGHPFAPIGRGEDLRCAYRALRSVGIRPKVFDVYGLQQPEKSVLHQDIASDLTRSLGDINQFFINGDEVEQVTNHMQFTTLRRGVSVVTPAWELEKYPDVWVEGLAIFDEIWAPSHFVLNSLKGACLSPLRLLPLAAEVVVEKQFSRAYFNIPAQAYAFLFSFDYRSYVSRKNPEAVLIAFSELLKSKPNRNCILVLKVHGDASSASSDLLEMIDALGDRVVVINKTMTDDEVRSLIRVCDCYVSLHRSEGFGRGMAEAMFHGKPVIATAYSGNLDFMNNDNGFLVPYSKVSLKDGDYPYGKGQVWADPDVSVAASYMKLLANDPLVGYARGRRASIDIRTTVGFRSVGVRYLHEFERICSV